MCFHLLYVSTQKNSQRLPCNYIWKCLFYNRQIWNVTFFDEMFHQIEMDEVERPLNSFNPNSAINLKPIMTEKKWMRNDSGDYMTKLRYLTKVNLFHSLHFLSWLTFLMQFFFVMIDFKLRAELRVKLFSGSSSSSISIWWNISSKNATIQIFLF